MPEKTAQKEPGKKSAPSKKPKPHQEVVVQIPLSELLPFPDHPFQVREDASMQETAESVKEYGVLVPALARPREDGGYELIAGHRRKHACKLAGLTTMPVIVRNIDRDAATIIMVDSNLQRENILPSERAKAYKMKMEAIKRQGARTDLTSPKISAKFRSDDEVGQDAGVSGDTIRNYIALTQLVPELQQMVDEKKIALSPAYQLAALTPKEQGLLLETIDSEQATPSLSQAQRMKKLSQSGELNKDTMLSIMMEQKKPEKNDITGVYVIGKRAVLEVGGTRSRLKDRESWYIIPDHHPAIVEKAVFDTVQASQLRFSQPNKKKRDYPLKGKAFCGCCGHALSRTMQKTSYYYCSHSEADEESRCHKMRLNATELEQMVFLTLKKQMEAAAPLAPDGTRRVDASVPERAEYEQQIEALQDGKRTLYERYLMGEIDLNTYKAEKAACDELLLKTKNAYAAVLVQAKQKQDEQARQDSRKEASKAIFDVDTLTTELAELLIDRVLVYPDKRIEIAYKIRDIFD